MANARPCFPLSLYLLALGLQVPPALAEVPDEIIQSVEALTAQAEAGDPEAQFGLGLYLQHSKPLLDGSSIDYGRVVDLYWSAATQGHTGASFALARLYDQGLGVERDLHRAIQFYTRAAEEGHAEAMGWLGAAYVELGDFTWAYIWNSRAAELGDPGGLNGLGALYHSGLGTETDYVRAMELYGQAAEAGDCLALMNIGGLYYNGDGVPQDGEEAERWFEAARTCETDEASFVEEYTAKYMDNIRSGALPTPDPQIEGSELLAGVAILAILAGVAASSDASAGVQGENPPDGEWKARYWCYTDFLDPDPVNKPTYCKDQSGVARLRDDLFDPCSGVEGWCDGFGLGPQDGFAR